MTKTDRTKLPLRRLVRPATGAGLLALLAGCGPVVASHPPVPAVLAEQVPLPPPAPVPLIWQPGHFDWTGVAYVWQPGAWVTRGGHGTLWQDGYWESGAPSSVWVPGHWI